MGTILHQRTSGFCKVSFRQREFAKISWDDDSVTRTKMGRRSQNDKTQKSLQAERELTSQDNVQPVDKRLRQRPRRHKDNSPSTKQNTSQPSTPDQSDATLHLAAAAADRKEPSVQPGLRYGRRQEQDRAGPRRSSSSRPPAPDPSEPRPDPPKARTPSPDAARPSGRRHAEPDSDSDLSESEKRPVRPAAAAPRLDLRAEVIDPDDFLRPRNAAGRRGRNGGGAFAFPDSLPPPFNSWNLGQLALFYHAGGGRGAPRPRSLGPLERYLDRLLELEWRQFQTVQEEGGRSDAAGGRARAQAPPLSARLSCPKSILQCQCAFPLVFLPSLDGHAATQLAGCSCASCRTHYASCRRRPPQHGLLLHQRQSRLGPEPGSPDRTLPPLLPPKRSYSESRAPRSSDKAVAAMASGVQRLGSPAARRRGSGHLKRMQASGNIRNPAPRRTTGEARSVAEGLSGDTEERGPGGSDGHDAPKDPPSGRAGQRRSCSEQRRGGAERRRRSGSECWRGGGSSERKRSGSERRRTAVSERQELKPDVIGAMVDHLLGSKSATVVKPNGRLKHVGFMAK